MASKPREPGSRIPASEHKSLVDWSEEVEDEFDAEAEKGKVKMPPMTELLRDAQEVEQAVEESSVKPASSGKSKLSTPEARPSVKELDAPNTFESDLDELVNTPTKKVPAPGTLLPKVIPKGPVRIPSQSKQETTDYEESFTSQQETAEIRGQIESFDNRMKVLEQQIRGMLSEREQLPRHLDRHRNEINTQLTLMSDKLYTILESKKGEDVARQTKIDLTTVKEDSDEVINRITTDLQSPPTDSSVISKSAPIKTKGKRVRLII